MKCSLTQKEVTKKLLRNEVCDTCVYNNGEWAFNSQKRWCSRDMILEKEDGHFPIQKTCQDWKGLSEQQKTSKELIAMIAQSDVKEPISKEGLEIQELRDIIDEMYSDQERNNKETTQE